MRFLTWPRRTCLPEGRLSSGDGREGRRLPGVSGLEGYAISAGKGPQMLDTTPGTPRAPATPVETLDWMRRQPVSRWAITRVRPRPDDVKQGPVVLAIFLVTQFLDGALTYWGVMRFGIEIEMNSLLATFMHHVGPGTALVGAKVLACSCGLLLYINSYLRPLAAVAGLCLGLAVVPWIVVATWLG